MRKIALIALASVALVASEIYATFDVKPIREAALSFTVGGTVEKLFVDVGDSVKTGDTLAQLENLEQFASLKLAQNDLRSAQLQAQQAQNSYERYAKVKEIVDEEKFDTISFQAQIAQVGVKKAERNVQLRQAQYDKTYLKAPFDGIITQRTKEVGDSVSGAQLGTFFYLMDVSQVKLLIEFDEKYASSVAVGDSFVYYVGGNEQAHNARISKIYPTSSAKTRKITAEVITTGHMPGLFGYGTIKGK
ncbi:MAG: hypothetical protein KU28_01485 [Sulfurovum sp. PC08-66]|nr:MAG: hypothetical protein KU28_01485 [Sulfurovum sp. PC08-66]KIM12615.1 MAG: hypothetical protein KU37_01600 [Sulfuricurvum sp. PC08-66]